MLLLLYSYTRDTPPSADDFPSRTVSDSGRNGLSDHVWPEIPVSSHLSPFPLPFFSWNAWNANTRRAAHQKNATVPEIPGYPGALRTSRAKYRHSPTLT